MNKQEIIQELIDVNAISQRVFAQISLGFYEVLEKNHTVGESFHSVMMREADKYYGSCDLSEVLKLKDDDLYQACKGIGMVEAQFDHKAILPEISQALSKVENIFDEEAGQKALIEAMVENPEKFPQSAQALLAILSGDEQRIRGIMLQCNKLGMDLASGDQDIGMDPEVLEPVLEKSFQSLTTTH